MRGRLSGCRARNRPLIVGSPRLPAWSSRVRPGAGRFRHGCTRPRVRGWNAWPVGPITRGEGSESSWRRPSPHGDGLPDKGCFATAGPLEGGTDDEGSNSGERSTHRRIPRRHWRDAFDRMTFQGIGEPVSSAADGRTETTERADPESLTATRGRTTPAVGRRTGPRPPQGSGRSGRIASPSRLGQRHPIPGGGRPALPLRRRGSRRPIPRLAGTTPRPVRGSEAPVGLDDGRARLRTWVAPRCSPRRDPSPLDRW